MTNNDIYDIFDMYGAITYTMYVCQYGCQKNRQDLRKAANHLKYSTELFLGFKIEISFFQIFPLYFLEFPLYIWDALSRQGLFQKYIVF